MTSVAAGPWIRLYCVLVADRPERAAAGDDLARGVRGGVRGHAGRRRSRRGCRTRLPRRSAELRHRLLVVLRAAARAVAARLPPLRRPAPDQAEDRRPALRRRGDTVRRVREAAAGVPARERAASARCASGSRSPRRSSPRRRAGPTKRVALLGGWHTLTWQPKRAGRLPRAHHGDGLERATASSSTRRRSCASAAARSRR